MNTAIVDDETAIAEQLKSFIRAARPQCTADVFKSAEAMLSSGKRYDIVFLDIRMDGMSGMDAARLLRKRDADCAIVFVTGTKEHVFDAFDVGAFHYLLKPADPAKVAEVFERAAAEVERRSERAEPVVIKTRGKSFALERRDVLYAESRAKKVEIHTQKEVIGIYASMRELEAMLGGGFYRTHRCYIVNMAHIAEYTGESVLLGNGESVLLAKERSAEFVRAYMRYLRSGGAVGVRRR